jgi:methyl coenzyme M reductase alpha subunit
MHEIWRWLLDTLVAGAFSIDTVAIWFWDNVIQWVWQVLILGVVVKAVAGATIGKWSVRGLDLLFIALLVKTKKEAAIIKHYFSHHEGSFINCHQPDCMAAKMAK